MSEVVVQRTSGERSRATERRRSVLSPPAGTTFAPSFVSDSKDGVPPVIIVWPAPKSTVSSGRTPAV